ncbi:hypothetical protein Tsubulata_036727 [Turnera subulata]|uniref:RING-type E3 ubiquitin transferase n=1 Tax=Turnera subulata TaxID=218843 RepID=A0A9Q0JC54_9ROSI|nr:hypothetical protein Tsubulata_036727 [Turnera subulata]
MMEEDSQTPKSSPGSNNSNNPHLNPFKSPLNLLLLLISLALLLLITPASSAAATTDKTQTLITPTNFLPYYTQHCNHIVPQSPLTPNTNFASLNHDAKPLHIDISYVTGGARILPRRAVGSGSPPVSLSFNPKRNSFSLTQDPNVVHLQASLRLHLPFHSNYTWGRNLRGIRYRPPRIPIRPRVFAFQLYGFWSVRTGELCMVGSGPNDANLGGVSTLDVVLKLNYPVNFSEVGSLISGVLESLGDYFEPVWIMGVPHFGKFNYTLINEGHGNVCAGGNESSGGKDENLTLELHDPNSCLNQFYRYASKLELDYGSGCGSNEVECNPLGEGFGVLPKFMAVQSVRCGHGGGIRALVSFSESGDFVRSPFAYKAFDPNLTLIGEAVWDAEGDRLCMVACRFLNLKDSLANVSVGDCSIRLSLRFPRTLTIRQRSIVVGQISSNKTVNETGYFRKIEFHGPSNMLGALPGLKYEYTVLDRVSKSCAQKKIRKVKGKNYPNGYSSDMRFDILVKNSEGQTAEGYFSPLFVGDRLYDPYGRSNNHSGMQNISYKISFSMTSHFRLGDKLLSKESVEIAAEGVYDKESGVLCMIGCWNGVSPVHNSPIADCDILVNAQFSPLDGKSRVSLKGTIESLREKSDPLYFRQLEMSSNSIYASRAVESIWRMDVEITMVLISNTFACVFVGLQLCHVKKHSDLLPFISFVMLIILTLGHMIPLLLNFEALFMGNRYRPNYFLESGGWLEVNEVAVRVVTMVAFLLQFRLLQLTWSARQTTGRHDSLWPSDKKVLYVSLPFYVGGGLIAWYASHWKTKDAYGNHFLLFGQEVRQQNYGWEELKSYAGLILDGFLLPQIMFNLFSNCEGSILAFPFYFGITLVRLLPHAYDLYRAHSSAWYLDFSYIYANHVQDFYSTAWDIIIPLCGMLFASLIFLQQRYGGRCLLPKRFRKTSGYEKVPVVIGQELQETTH